MSTMNVFVGNLQFPPFPAGQSASEVYKTLKDAYGGGGLLVGPDGVGILNNSKLIPAGNYTYVPVPGAPLLKKPKRSQDDEELASGALRYFEKLLEPPADLPRTSAELEEFLGQITVKLPVWNKMYIKVWEPTLLTQEFSEEVIELAALVECLLAQNVGNLNEATSSANLYQLSGQFIDQLNELAPLSRTLDSVLVLLDSPNPNSCETASKPLERLAGPDMQLFVKGCLILRWENKLKYESLAEAVHENRRKLKAWSPLFYGALPYVIGGCCAGNQFRWLRLMPGDKGVIDSEFISPSYNLNSMKGVAAFLCSNIRMHCLLQKLQECLTDPINVILYQPKYRDGGVTVTIYPDVVRKEIIGEDKTIFTWRQSLYESIVHSRYLIESVYCLSCDSKFKDANRRVINFLIF